jgi:hypothetical protein
VFPGQAKIDDWREARQVAGAAAMPGGTVYNHFNIERHMISRPTLRGLRSQAFASWREIAAA